MNLRQGKYGQPVKDLGEDVHGTHLRPALKGQTPSKSGTHLCFYLGPYFQPISIQGPNHTPRMHTSPSLQRKGPGRGTPPLQAPNRRPSHSSKLILAPATSSYFFIAFFIAFMSDRRDIKTVISSAYTKIFILTRTAKRTPRRAGFAVPSLSLRNRGSKART